MTITILTTKLYVPRPRIKLVARQRLNERLATGLSGKLILISAPVGFGKTTLISEWLKHASIPTAWVSLDEGDSDLSRFLTYLVAAIRTIAPNIGASVLAVLQANQPPATEVLLTLLLNDLAAFTDDFLLVLDDYHRIDAKAVDDAITFLLEHMPPQMHLLITTRGDPNLPLARLRARSQLTELRATDLRFTLDEAADFLAQIMGLDLPIAAITALEERTEGWIAGLQLAALSLQGNSDIAEFLQSFAGNHRYIVDYLVDEVLAKQTETVRKFLIETSILERLNGKLCDAVTNQSEGTEQLEKLERGNFFLIPLDDQRHWYRYHHLFADVLRLHLMAELPQQVHTLHLRASDWYEQNGWMADAIYHALAGKDFERVAGLIEAATPDMRRTRQETSLLGWYKALPDEVFRNRPVLNIEYVGVLLTIGETQNAEIHLQNAERWMNATTNAEMLVINKLEFSRLTAWIALYRAALSLALGNITNTIKYAGRVQHIVADDDHLLRGSASGLMGLASWSSGNLEIAFQSYADGMAHLKMAGNISDAIGGSLALADIQIVQGHLRHAHRIYEQGLALATQYGEPQIRGTADMYVGLSEIYLQYNKLQLAEQYLLKAKEQGDHTGFPQNPYRWRVAMARLQQAKGDLDGALDLLHEAERLYISDFYPNVRPVAALKTRILLVQRNLAAASIWLREQSLAVQDDLSYLREFEHITLVRVLLAQYQRHPSFAQALETMKLLDRLLKAAESGGRTGSVIEILILQALAYQMQGDIIPALLALEHALKLTEPEGYIRIFLDEDASMEKLLHEAAARKIMLDYTRRLLDAFDEQQIATTEAYNVFMPPSQELLEPLSQRELEILRLFKTDLSGPEIARELLIALSTLRSHTKSIYSKLSVNSRRSAVTRASELNLI